jgi:hypothetical protein
MISQYGYFVVTDLQCRAAFVCAAYSLHPKVGFQVTPISAASADSHDATKHANAHPQPIGLPHFVQKRTPAALRVPQRLQLRPATPVSSELPQEVQKRSSARLG